MTDQFNAARRLLVSLLLTSASSCTLLTQTQQGTYTEDLSKHRKPLKSAPKEAFHDVREGDKQKHIPAGSLQTVTEQLDDLLERKKLASKQIKSLQGYTIQVYAGGSREAAFKVRNQLYTHYPTLKPEVRYDLPNYTVRIGRFLDKLEAYAVYATIKKHMPQAMIRPTSFANTPPV